MNGTHHHVTFVRHTDVSTGEDSVRDQEVLTVETALDTIRSNSMRAESRRIDQAGLTAIYQGPRFNALELVHGGGSSPAVGGYAPLKGEIVGA